MPKAQGQTDEEGDELGYKTLGQLRRLNFADKDIFIEYIVNRLGYVTESYFSNTLNKITFTYIVKNGLALDTANSLQESDNTPYNHKFNNLNLPISMNPSNYGTIKVQNFIQKDNQTFERFVVTSGYKTFMIDIYNELGINKVQMLGNVDLSWVDTKIDDDSFKREIGKSIIYFSHGQIILRKKRISCKPFSTHQFDQNLGPDIVTLDIETVNVNNKHIPYAVCAYNGSSSIKTYANLIEQNGTQVIDQLDLFSRFIKQLCTFFNKNKVLTVYAHNLSGFDGIFLLRHLLPLGKVEPLIHNGRIISIRVKLIIAGYVGKTILFKDSMLLLPKDLRSLCISYKVETQKGHFPFKFNNINYIGKLPNHSLWPGVSNSEYLDLNIQFKNKIWNFKDEALKYCLQDCVSLHQVLTKYNELIFNEFKINIHSVLTLPSLSMKIYKSGHMPANTLYQLLGPAEKDIRQSYTGGAVDVYIPKFKAIAPYPNMDNQATMMQCYDVNALYPYVMANAPTPVGKPVAFTGDIRAIEPKAFGFFYCEITSPLYLEHPILQRKIKTNQGLRTIAGLGTWKGWIFSGEMDNAMRFGYTFTILKGYEFQEGLPFKSYMEKMYNLRMKYPKGDPMNDIAKLLQNSLYGKFGMNSTGTVVDMFDINDSDQKELLESMLDAYGLSVNDFVKIDNHVITIRDDISRFQYSEEMDMFHGTDVNVAVASAVTANGRMWMSMFKNNPDFKLYYSDTDSIFVVFKSDNTLKDFIGTNIGQLKLEYNIKEAVFLALAKGTKFTLLLKKMVLKLLKLKE